MIRLEGIGKDYGPTAVLRGIDLHVARGELAVLIGPSGCGKTTLLRIVNRLIEPSAGRLTIDGRDALATDPVQLRRGIGYVIQGVGLFPHMSVLDNVEVVPRLLGWSAARRRERAEALLALVGLEPARFARRYPKELSGGQQQRVGIARALAADPALLLMDEPFSALDPLTRERLQDELLRIQAQLHKTIVFVTHDLDEAVRLGDRIALMREGRIVQHAAPDALLHRPTDDFAARFVGEERELKRLGRRTALELMRPAADGDGPCAGTIVAQASARAALSRLLGGEETLAVVDEHGRRIGRLTLADFAKAP